MAAETIIKGDYFSGAVFSQSMKHRYALWRIWVEHEKPNKPQLVAFVCLNPRSGNHTDSDPIVGRCVAFANDWGYDGTVVINVYSYISDHPDALYRKNATPVGLLNGLYQGRMLNRSSLVVCCWGDHGNLNGASKAFITDNYLSHKLYCFSKTVAGFPKEILYIKKGASLELLNG